MKRFLGFLLLLASVAGFGQSKTEVLLLGTFHFDNPGLDAAKFENANVLSAKRQAELNGIIRQLKAFKPDKIFVEYPPEMQGWVDSAFNQYKIGTAPPSANEVVQIGYRLAKELSLPTVYAVDYRNASLRFDSLFKMAAAAGQSNLLDRFRQTIDSIQKSFNAAVQTQTIKELLLARNSDASRRLEVGFYYEFLAAGDTSNHVGAYVASEWWRRNLVIYANILKRLQPSDKRVLVLFGSAHTSLLHEMMKYNERLTLVPVQGVLR